jgi:hypothetical protein
MIVVDDATVVAAPRRPKVRLGAVVALAATAAAAAWVFAGRADGPSPPPEPAPALTAASPQPRLVTATELGGVGTPTAPVYWVGPRSGDSYELTQTTDGRVFVRYLGEPSQLGSPRADFLAVATYAQRDAYAAIVAAAKRPGAIALRPANGGLAVYDRARPTSIFLAYPGGTQQIEVYDPEPAEARRLVESGAVTPVPQPGAPRIASPAELRELVSVGRLYWAGARAPSSIELTQTTQGNVFLRYLARVSELGSPSARFLTVATYRRPDAVAGLVRAARRPGAVRMGTPGGGIAVYDRARPTSVYLAYPGDDRQIEVYHPDAREARRLVAAGAIVAVP